MGQRPPSLSIGYRVCSDPSDISILKSGTPDEALAKEFYKQYCILNEINPDRLSLPNGALTLV